MASKGAWVFLLEGETTAVAQAGKIALIHVFSAIGSEESRRAVYPPNTRGRRPTPNGLPSQPPSINR
jgi:hypothetical protein